MVRSGKVQEKKSPQFEFELVLVLMLSRKPKQNLLTFSIFTILHNTWRGRKKKVNMCRCVKYMTHNLRVSITLFNSFTE